MMAGPHFNRFDHCEAQVELQPARMSVNLLRTTDLSVSMHIQYNSHTCDTFCNLFAFVLDLQTTEMHAMFMVCHKMA